MTRDNAVFMAGGPLSLALALGIISPMDLPSMDAAARQLVIDNVEALPDELSEAHVARLRLVFP